MAQYTVRRVRVDGLGGFTTPGTSRRQLNLLRDNWNMLLNQVEGRGLAHRHDVDSAAIDQIHQGYQHFRAWYDEVASSFASDMWGGYGMSFGVSELEEQQQNYNAAAQLAASILPHDEVLHASPVAPGYKASGAAGPPVGYIMLGVFGVAAALVGLYYVNTISRTAGAALKQTRRSA
jgi:hypothetical protein